MNAGTSFIAMLGGLLNAFAYCYVGCKPNFAHVSVGDLLYSLNWYKLPKEYRKYLILMIQDSQRPIYYHGFNLIYLHLETSTKVI